MKLFVTICCFILLFIAGCQKEITGPQTNDQFVAELYQRLRDSVQPETIQQLDWAHISRSSIDNGRITLVRIPFLTSELTTKFIAVKVNRGGVVQHGLILEYDLAPLSGNGRMRSSSLRGVLKEEWQLKDGYRVDRHLNKANVVPAPDYQELPEVIVTGSYFSSGSFNLGVYCSMISLLSTNEIVGGSGGGWYAPGPHGGGSGSAATAIPPAGSSGTAPVSNPGIPYTIVDDDLLNIEFEPDFDDPAISIEKFLKCFANIPDANSTCKIAIYADLPVDGDPTRIFDWQSMSPGHVFIRLEKKNGAAFAKQYFGFYPKSGWKVSATTATIDGKFVDNSTHEYNAYTELTITPAQLQMAIDRISVIAVRPQYIVDRYNCTDFGLNVWNSCVTSNFMLEIPLFHIPGSMVAQSSTPQGLYIKLQQLKNANHPLAANMQINVNGAAGTSTGECN